MKERFAGSLTVFYAGITLMMIALLGAVMESVRFHTAGSMISDSAYLALQNSLAGFQRELWDDYHIFFVDTREAGGVEGLREEMQSSLDRSWQQGGFLTERDWMGVACRADEIVPERYMTENKGVELEAQILAYMKYRAITGAGEMLLEQLGLMETFLKGEELFQRKLALEQSFSDLEEKKEDIIQQVDDMDTAWQQAGAALSSIYQKQQSMTEETEPEEGEESEQPDILAELDTIHRVAGNLASQSAYLQGECSDYRMKYQETEQQKVNYAAWLQEQRDGMDQQAWQSLQEDLQELEDWQAEDAGYVEGLEQPLDRNEAILWQLQTLCAQGMAAGSEAGENKDAGVSVDAMAAVLSGLMSQYVPMEVPEGYHFAAGGAGESPFRRLKSIAAEGVLGLVLPAGVEVSKARLKPAVWQEESEESTVEESETGTGEITTDVINRLLLVEYVDQHFGCFLDTREETALQYEREYLLIAAESDKNNLAGAVGELLLVRTTADYLYLLTLPEKVAEARELAMVIAGATGGSALVPVIKTGILLLWAVEDAVSDVQALMAGKKVALYQALEGAALDYEGYLNLLLLATGKEHGLRLARLIEGNVQLRYEEAFQASDCAAGLGLNLTAEITPKLIREEPWRITEEYHLGYQK